MQNQDGFQKGYGRSFDSPRYRGGYGNQGRSPGFRYRESYGNASNNNQEGVHRDFRRDGGRSLKRRRYDDKEDIENRLNSLIVRIGDPSSSSLESNLQGLADALEGDVGHHRNQILTMIFTCVTQLPVKASVYGTLVGLMNAKNQEFGKEVIHRLGTELEQAFHKGNAKSIKLLVRFLAELANANVILPAALLSLFDSMLNIVVESKDEASVAQRRSDFFVYVILMTLPFAGHELADRNPEELDRILETIDVYISKRSTAVNPAIAVFDTEEGQDFFHSLWKRIQLLKEDNWTTSSVLKPYVAFQNALNSATQHDLPAIVPQSEGIFRYEGPRSTFRLFDHAKVTEIDAVDQLLLEDYIVDILYFFSTDHKTAAKFLLTSLPITANYDYLLIETIFGQMFLLPKPPFKPVYYGVILADLCKTNERLAPVLGLAIETIFDRLETMDVECIDRFTDWFAHHLSNFDYKWEWLKWDRVLTMEPDKRAVLVVKEVLEKAVRLSYWERVRRAIPDPFEVLMPPKPQPRPSYTAASGEWKHYEALLTRMRSKHSSELILRWLAETELSHETKLHLVMDAVCAAGAKSFSHLLNVLERYNELLRTLVNNESRRVAAIGVVASFWTESAGHIVIALDKLMTYRVVDNLSIVNWLFSAETLPNFKRSYVWDILRNTVNKTIARTATLTKEMENAKRAVSNLGHADESSAEVLKLRQTSDAVDTAMREQKELLLVIFQRFTVAISHHLANNGEPYDCWYRITCGHLKETGRKYHKELEPCYSTLETAIFSSEADARLSNIFHMFKHVY